MVRFFAERKTKATRTDSARRFPTFAHRSQNGGAIDSPREEMCCIRAFSFVVSRAEKKKKSGALDQMRLVGVDATAISVRGNDFGESGRPTKRTMRWWSPNVGAEASPRGGFRCHFFFFVWGSLFLGTEARESKCFGCTTKWCLHQLCERRARAFDDGFFPRFFLRTLPTSQRTDDDAFFSHSSTGYRSRSWRPQQKDEAHQAKV